MYRMSRVSYPSEAPRDPKLTKITDPQFSVTYSDTVLRGQNLDYSQKAGGQAGEDALSQARSVKRLLWARHGQKVRGAESGRSITPFACSFGSSCYHSRLAHPHVSDCERL